MLFNIWLIGAIVYSVFGGIVSYYVIRNEADYKTTHVLLATVAAIVVLSPFWFIIVPWGFIKTARQYRGAA